jgi:ribonuclease HI
LNPARLLRAVYESIRWESVYEKEPDATREQVDELFRRMGEAVGEEESGGEASVADVAGGEAWVHTDGAARGNPGPAGIGIVITTADGREVLAWGRAIGEATNNVAEYAAAIEGLKKAGELGVRAVRLRADSELLIRQVEGRYKVKNAGLKPLHAEVVKLLQGFEEWHAEYIPREQNAAADALAGRHAKKGAARG